MQFSLIWDINCFQTVLSNNRELLIRFINSFFGQKYTQKDTNRKIQKTFENKEYEFTFSSESMRRIEKFYIKVSYTWDTNEEHYCRSAIGVLHSSVRSCALLYRCAAHRLNTRIDRYTIYTIYTLYTIYIAFFMIARNFGNTMNNNSRQKNSSYDRDYQQC